MFTTASSLSNLNVPHLETRKALIVINMQKDSFYLEDDLFTCKNQEFVEALKPIIPRFREAGDIVWVQTELDPPAASSRKPGTADRKIYPPGKPGKEMKVAKLESEDDTDGSESESEGAESDAPPRRPVKWKDPQAHHLLSHVKSLEMRASEQVSVEQRPASKNILNDNTKRWEKRLAASSTGHHPKFYSAGTPGVELLDGMKDLVDEEKDMTLIKHFYSAFDQTSLLMSLRMRLVTEIYICGCFTSVGVYATAADAVQHGFEINIIEDCVGYRSADKHDDAMRQMADVLGVNGITSEEIIAELEGHPPPDAAEPMFSGPGLQGIQAEAPSPGNSRFGVAPARAAAIHKAAEPDEEVLSREARSMKQRAATTRKKLKDRGGGGIASNIVSKAKTANKSLLRQPVEPSPPPSSMSTVSKSRTLRPTGSSSLKGPGDSIGTGDCRIIYEILSPRFREEAFDLLKDEVDWKIMHHRGGEVPRLVAVQGQIGPDGSVPIYRHPADEPPPLLRFSPTIDIIRKEVEGAIKQPLNHALIQLYRGGNDNISEHSDKTLDIVRGSNIINLSLGAQRVMTLRTKKSKRNLEAADVEDLRQSHRIPLPHNSAFVLGPRTNAHWLHGVRADKRPEQQKGIEERSYEGERISITFRHIGTFMDEESRKIWGQGAKGKTKSSAGGIPHGDTAQMEAMIVAFGKENHQAGFDWDAEYGEGFDVVNLVETA